jgi:LacI family transcriptional regulator
MATIREVAKAAGVSVGTVSNLISRTAPVSARRQERILAAIRELNYQPSHIARSLKLRCTKTLGMAISDITNPFFPLLVRGAEDAALKHGYLLFTANTDDRVDREREILSVLRERRVDGVLLVMAPNDGDVSHITKTLEAGIPIVCVDRVPSRIKVDSVTIDNRKSSRECVRHLLAIGHKRIAIITGPAILQTGRDRLQGYRQALEGARIPIDDELILEGNFRIESGYALGRELLNRKDRPSAVFVSNGMMTLGVLQAIDELGLRCPNDIALATIDDLQLAPRLTAVAQPAYLMGYKGAELLIQRIKSKKAPSQPRNIRLAAELKIRESTVGPANRN